MRITAYKCDVCGSISEKEPKYSIDSSYNFELTKFHSWEFKKSACCDVCAMAALNAYLAEAEKPEPAIAEAV